MSRQSTVESRRSIEQNQSTRTRQIQEDFQQKMDLEELLNCTRCGFCQPSCPTFVQTEGKEASSPRGRIALMKAVVDGVLEPDEHFERELNLCLGCRACESACPSGVNYGQLLEQARAIMNEHKTYSWPVRTLRSLFFKRVLPSAPVLKTTGTFLWFYQKAGLQWLVQKTKLLHVLLPANLRAMEKILPEISAPTKLWQKDEGWKKAIVVGHTQHEAISGQLTPKYEAMAQRHQGAEELKYGDAVNGQAVQFFKGCIMDMMFNETNKRTVELAQCAGFDVHLPKSQTCCGALHAHAGDIQTSIELAKKNIVAFEQQEQTSSVQILTNAGGCGAFLLEYPHLLRDEPEWQERAQRFADRIVDISEWLTENSTAYQIEEQGSYSGSSATHTSVRQHSLRESAATSSTSSSRTTSSFEGTGEQATEVITYQDSCHLRHGMKVNKAPRQLLQQTEGVQFKELKNAHMCCGSAGIYNIIEQEMSMKVLDHKMQEVKKTQAKTIVTSNPGCLLQMKLGIEREGLQDSMRAVHLVDFLYEKQASQHVEQLKRNG